MRLAFCFSTRRLAVNLFLSASKYTGRQTYWIGLKHECAAARPAPMLPAAFEAMVRAGIADGGLAFTHGKDATGVCIPQYEKGFLDQLGTAKKLVYRELNWGPAEADPPPI